MSDWIFVVIRIDRRTNASTIWKVVSTVEQADAYRWDDDDDYWYRYEEWRVSGRRL